LEKKINIDKEYYLLVLKSSNYYLLLIYIRGLFGLNILKESDKVIVITEGEFDAMAVY
jgi:hypothetical protein